MILAGKEYGSGSSRDWAAKGVKLLGVSAVIAESFERIHRTNLVGMGVLPLQFEPGQSAQSLKLSGKETFHVEEIRNAIAGNHLAKVTAIDPDGNTKTVRRFGSRRYAAGSGILPAWRHTALCAPPTRRVTPAILSQVFKPIEPHTASRPAETR